MKVAVAITYSKNNGVETSYVQRLEFFEANSQQEALGMMIHQLSTLMQNYQILVCNAKEVTDENFN
jgi:hypothetical protein